VRWLAWWLMVRSIRWWATSYMDEFELLLMETDWGPVYVTLSRRSEWPDTFDRVMPNGRVIPPDEEDDRGDEGIPSAR